MFKSLGTITWTQLPTCFYLLFINIGMAALATCMKEKAKQSAYERAGSYVYWVQEAKTNLYGTIKQNE